MRNLFAVLGSAAALVVVVYLASRRSSSRSSALQPIAVEALPVTPPPATPWMPPAAATPYLPTIYAAERANKIPHNLLARLLQQESGFRPDVISGQVKSSAGAVGIAQLEPQYFPGVDATNWIQSIDAAGAYLAKLHSEFGTWALALAAYDWGPGELAKWQAGTLAQWPPETVAYVDQITNDVPVV